MGAVRYVARQDRDPDTGPVRQDPYLSMRRAWWLKSAAVPQTPAKPAGILSEGSCQLGDQL
jgi:hypothetical protein